MLADGAAWAVQASKLFLMCLGATQDEARAMSEELAAVLLCRQQAERVLGLGQGKHGKVLVTVQGDGVITYAAAREASGHSRALGSSQAQLLAPVQQLDNSYVAAVQPQGSAYGVLVSAPIASQQLKPLLDSEQQLPLPSKLHSLHVLQPAQPSGSGKPGSAVAAVVLADGTVAAADFKQTGLQTTASWSSAAAASSGQQRSSPHRLLHAACSGELLAVAKQQAGQHAAVDVYCAKNSTSSNGVDAALQLQQSILQLVHSCSVRPPSTGSKLAGVSVAGGLLVLMWSCHTVTVCCSRQPSPVNTMRLPPALAAALPAGSEEEVNPAERSASKRKQRPAAATSGCNWTAAALSEQHVLLLAVHGGAGGSQVQYALLDSCYSSCLSSGSFTAGSGSISGRLQLLPLPQHPFAPVALLVAGAVWLLPLQLPKADLAGLVSHLGLGSTQAHAAAVAVTPNGTQLLLTSRQQLNLSAIAAAVSNGSAGVQQQQQGPCVLQQLQPQPTAATGDVPAAVQEVQQVLSKQKRPVQELQDATTQLCEALEQQQQQQQQQGQASAAVLVSAQLLAQALSALAEAQEWALLDRLHSLAPLQSLAACADVVPALAASQQYSSMRKLLLAAHDIPAEAVVRAVQQVLQAQQQQGHASDPQQAAAQQIRAAAEAVVQQAETAAAAGPSDDTVQLIAAARHAAAAVDGFTSRELLLHVLLSVQVDSVEAQAVLRALPAAAVLRLLRYMVKWLHKYSRTNISCPSTDPLLCAPAAVQVVEWCKLLLDAQLTKLLMMPVAAPLLQQLQQLLRVEVAATSKLVALKGVTDTWASGAPLPAAVVAANSQYVLELLDLRVNPLAVGARGK